MPAFSKQLVTRQVTRGRWLDARRLPNRRQERACSHSHKTSSNRRPVAGDTVCAIRRGAVYLNDSMEWMVYGRIWRLRLNTSLERSARGKGLTSSAQFAQHTGMLCSTMGECLGIFLECSDGNSPALVQQADVHRLPPLGPCGWSWNQSGASPFRFWLRCQEREKPAHPISIF